MKYWLLYWKDIEKMHKEELCEHLVDALCRINYLQQDNDELRLKAIELLSRKKFLWLF